MAMINQKPIYTLLMFAGCIPFLVGAIAPYLRVYELPIFGNIQNSVAYYALGIACFMAGSLWNLSMSPNAHAQHGHSPMCPNRMMYASNAFMLLPWLILSFAGIGVAYYFSLALVFTLMMLTEYRLADRGLASDHYLRMRLVVTAIVVTCLVSLAFTAA